MLHLCSVEYYCYMADCLFSRLDENSANEIFDITTEQIKALLRDNKSVEILQAKRQDF